MEVRDPDRPSAVSSAVAAIDQVRRIVEKGAENLKPVLSRLPALKARPCLFFAFCTPLAMFCNAIGSPWSATRSRRSLLDHVAAPAVRCVAPKLALARSRAGDRPIGPIRLAPTLSRAYRPADDTRLISTCFRPLLGPRSRGFTRSSPIGHQVAISLENWTQSLRCHSYHGRPGR